MNRNQHYPQRRMAGATVKPHSVTDNYLRNERAFANQRKKFRSTKRPFHSDTDSNAGSEQLRELLEHTTQEWKEKQIEISMSNCSLIRTINERRLTTTLHFRVARPHCAPASLPPSLIHKLDLFFFILLCGVLPLLFKATLLSVSLLK